MSIKEEIIKNVAREIESQGDLLYELESYSLLNKGLDIK